jgi:lysylphosphatidylglycerol synthetase-like protein (DUF2156 family)
MAKTAGAIAPLWVIVVGYWAVRTIQLSDEGCPDKIWDSGPKECATSGLDLIIWFGVPVMLLVTVAWLIGGLVRLIRRRRR